jgi:hypothetical protein
LGIVSDFLPKEVREGLELARRMDLAKKSRLRLHTDDDIYPVLRFWDGGFALDAAGAPHLRGIVDIYDGSRHLSHCLVIASEESGGEMIYEFKRQTAVSDKAPLDFCRDESAPVALIGRA